MQRITKGFGKLLDQNFWINVKLQTKIFSLKITHSLGLKKKNNGLENTLSKIVKSFRNTESIKIF